MGHMPKIPKAPKMSKAPNKASPGKVDATVPFGTRLPPGLVARLKASAALTPRGDGRQGVSMSRYIEGLIQDGIRARKGNTKL